MSSLDYLLYRCFKCGRLLTALEIERVWATAEKDTSKTVVGICPCGSSKIQPTNMTPEEKEELLHWWQQVRYFFGVRDHRTRVVEIYEKRVKGKVLGPLYKEGA